MDDSEGAFYRRALANSGLGLYEADRDGRLLQADDRLAHIFGFASPAAMAAGNPPIATLFFSDAVDAARFGELLRADGKVAQFLCSGRHAQGRALWLVQSGWQQTDEDGKSRIIGTVADVTTVVAAQVEAAGLDYRSIFENVDFGIYRTRPDGIQLRVNAALARINGFATPEEQIAAVIAAGKSGRDWYVAPERLAEFRALRARDGHVRGFESEIVRRATGERAWISEAGWEVRSPDGTLIAYEGTVADITERKTAEAQLRQAKIDAEAASAAKSAFLATMSHELRTPLNAIIGFSEIIADRLFGPEDPRYVSYAQDIRASGMHLLALINDILDLSKIAAGRLELAYAQVEVAPLLGLVAKLFSADAAKAGVALAVESTDAVRAFEADPMRLQQVLMNLVSNAVKFTPAGGQVRLFAAGDDALLRIGVADTGVGMTPEEAARATEPFVQIDAQLTRRHGGTGLGLAICKELVGLHGGTLTIESVKGEGTRVTAELPLARSS